MIWLACMVGAVSRHTLETYFNKNSMYVGTLIANTLGSFILGWAIATNAPDYVPAFCGVFTTFGGFIAQMNNDIKKSGNYLLATMLGSGLAATAGLQLFS
jgi:fluoride ion exporter CrcB/FEX